ncbi:magnesium transporter MgtE N-terminal domain-containing protein [Streptomyces sp. NPDC008139]|uniref:magnesium transporter MgtE N-terminal domain-containing protein n=1 Tax=Streptomyces sp. NPDC008139 TaxID=3364814 RepID=UPI0036EF1C65
MAAGSPRVFVSHLSGVAVFDPNGDQVGRVRDVVVMLRVGGRPPRVLGLVVEVVSRRRIFLPMTRVTGVESGQVITTGVLNMRRFEQRPTETLVLGELLDRRVRLVSEDPGQDAGQDAGGDGGQGAADASAGESGAEVTVLDVSMTQLPARRDWEIDKVFVRRGRPGALRRSRGARAALPWKGGGGRRAGATLTVDWSAVTGFRLAEDGQGAENLVATFEQLRPADLANVLHHLSPKRRGEVAAALDDDRLADVLEELPDDDQVEILSKLKEERAADVLEAMDPDDAADLLAELPADEQERLLTLMQPQDAAGVRRLLSYEERTAGGLMTTEPIVLRPDATVADALARIRNPDLSPALAAQVYVCRPPDETPTGKYLGLVHFQRLLRDPPFTLLASIVDTDLQPLTPDTPLPAVTSYLATYNMISAPVVNATGGLLGAVTVDDVLDHLLPEDWRETDLHGAVGPHGHHMTDDGTDDGTDDAADDDARGGMTGVGDDGGR